MRGARLWPVLALALAGCAGQQSLSRWSTAQDVPPWRPPVLYVASAPAASAAPSSEALTVKTLPERASAAYIAALAAKEADAKSLQAALGAKLGGGGGDGGGGAKDMTKAPRVLLVGVERQSVRPGDRLLATTISIRPANPGDFSFTDYELAATDRSTINIGSVSVTDARSADLNLTGGSGPASVTGGITASRTRTGTRAISAQAEFSVHVEPQRIEIYRTGAEGNDLTGNTLVKLAVRLPAASRTQFALARPTIRDEKGVILAPDKAKVALAFLDADPPRDLWVCARLAYEDRAIVEGEESLDEGRQKIAIRSGEGPWTPFLIAPAEDFETPLWKIVDPHGAELGFNDGIEPHPIAFDDYEQAQTFLAWVQRFRQAALANGTLEEAGHAPAFERLAVRRFAWTGVKTPVPSCGAEPAS
jgi:hypothetical protein